MKTAQEVLKLALYGTLIALVISVTVLVNQGRRWMTATEKRTDAILTHTDAVAARAQRTMEKIEAASLRQKEVSDLALAILGDVDSDVKAAYSTLDRTNRLLATATDQLKGFGADVDEVSVKTGQAVEDVKRALAPVPQLVVDADKTVVDADALLQDPAIVATATNVQLATKEVAGTAADVHAMSSDSRAYVHNLTRPVSGFVQIFHAVEGFGAKVVADWIP